MINTHTAAYRKQWQKENIHRVRMHKIIWYYRNRKRINLMFAKAKGIGEDEADIWFAKKYPNG